MDTREVASGIPDELERRGLYVQRKLLDVADYIIGSYAIERKSMRDFISSLYSGRLFEQAQRIVRAYERFILIVEGDAQETLSDMKNPNAYWGALLSIILDFNFDLFFTQDQSQTADLLCVLAKRRARGDERPLLVRKPRMGETRDWQLGVIESLPTIGPKLAEKLLNAFGSVRSIFLASRVELAVKGGIGEVRAEKIRKLIDAEIRTRTKQQKLD